MLFSVLAGELLLFYCFPRELKGDPIAPPGLARSCESIERGAWRGITGNKDCDFRHPRPQLVTLAVYGIHKVLLPRLPF